MKPVAWMYERPNGSSKLSHIRQPNDKDSVVKEYPLYKKLCHCQIQEASSESHARSFAKGWDEGIKWFKSKELSDEEILDLCPPNHSEMMNEAYTIDFAKKILKKATEK